MVFGSDLIHCASSLKVLGTMSSRAYGKNRAINTLQVAKVVTASCLEHEQQTLYCCT